MRRWIALTFLSCANLALGWGCSGGDQAGEEGGGSGGDSGGHSASGGRADPSVSGTGAGTSVQMGGAGPDLQLQLDGGLGGLSGAGGIGPVCSAVTQEAQVKALDIYILLDQSGSMVETDVVCTEPYAHGAPVSRWRDVVGAINSFTGSYSGAELNVGLGLFPPNNTKENFQSDYCPAGAAPNTATNPQATALVPIGPLAEATPKIAAALDFTPHFCNSTPTFWGISGAAQIVRAQATRSPDHVVALVIATDGVPHATRCTVEGGLGDTAVQPSANVAKALASEGIRTFVIGVGPNLDELDQVAAAGNTQEAFMVDGTDDTQSQFSQALAAIRKSAIACEVDIPAPPSGTEFVGDRVNVRFVDRTGIATDYARVDTSADCAKFPNSWYYDNPSNPKQIVLCETACLAAQDQSDGKVEVQFGCATKRAQIY